MTRLRDQIEAPVDEARLERQWGAINAAGLPSAAGHGRARWVWLLTGALTMAAIGGLVLKLRPARVDAPIAQQLPTGAVLESDEKEVAVALSDGSHVALAPRAQMRVRSNQPKVVELELESGTAHFDVRHDKTRRFAIRLGNAEVRVLGTQFDLERAERADGTFVRVTVREGVVEVQRTDSPNEIARIHASESWSALFPRNTLPATATATNAPEADVEPEQEQEAPRVKPKHEPRAAEREVETDASELFGQATLARRAGRMREAADSYRDLLARFPSDPRTGLSAFELGRLRMDALNDQAGAIDALERALKSSTSASFREDALARIVVASDALGRTQQCLQARERYTKQYPNGVHASALAQRCK